MQAQTYRIVLTNQWGKKICTILKLGSCKFLCLSVLPVKDRFVVYYINSVWSSLLFGEI